MAIIQNLEAFVQSYPAGLDSVTDLQLSQNENGRQIRFTIGGVTIPAGSVATISGTKPDGVVYSNTGTIEGSDTVIFDEDVQMTAVFGTWYAKIRITNAGNTIASARVRFIIDKDPVDAGAIPSESQLNGLVAEAEEYAGAAEDAAERAAITYGSPLTAATASAMTDINRVYVYTGSESGYTYGNWYYYNGSAWVSGGVYNSAAVETDTTLTESGVPADAKATGDKIDELKDDLSNIQGISEDVKVALLACFENVAWTDEHGQDYYDALYDALYEEEPPTPSFDYGVYEPESIINGKYIDGTGTVVNGEANKSFYIEDYIPVVKGSYWIGFQPPTMRTDYSHYWSESNWRVSEYDNNKQFIKQTQYAGSQSVGAKSAAIVSFEQNTKYIRLGFYDYYNSSSSPNHVFDIEDPATITELPMEQGDINVNTGQNAPEPRRVRTIGYIPITGSTVTVKECPFYTSWASFNPNSLYAVRCYDSNKTYLGNVACNEAKVMDDVNIPSGTAYARMIMQGGGEDFNDHAKLSAYLFTVNNVRYFVT